MATDIGLEIDEDPAWDAEPNPELVHWQATHRPDRAEGMAATFSPGGALGAIALGSMVFGAVAVGALAVGALAIGRLAIGRASIRRLEIDEFVVGRLSFRDD